MRNGSGQSKGTSCKNMVYRSDDRSNTGSVEWPKLGKIGIRRNGKDKSANEGAAMETCVSLEGVLFVLVWPRTACEIARQTKEAAQTSGTMNTWSVSRDAHRNWSTSG